MSNVYDTLAILVLEILHKTDFKKAIQVEIDSQPGNHPWTTFLPITLERVLLALRQNLENIADKELSKTRHPHQAAMYLDIIYSLRSEEIQIVILTCATDVSEDVVLRVPWKLARGGVTSSLHLEQSEGTVTRLVCLLADSRVVKKKTTIKNLYTTA